MNRPDDHPHQRPRLLIPLDQDTYRQIAEWKALIRARPPSKHMELVAWLKAEHEMGHGHAKALVAPTLAWHRG
ncbi:DUF4287 domain-containing protein [Sphingomonas sinipercae]|uniref:DUF4287 domain-containing protein n=1 Tax=Sphingomonas sinipercae TaxID=2714944 RepID=UPI001FED02D1|nr:DUF4287 domain-containing protein [Sphingomonas sinipercae]